MYKCNDIEFYGVQYFYNGEEQKAMFGQEPVVQIGSAEDFQKTMPGANSVIIIGYIPPDNEKKEE